MTGSLPSEICTVTVLSRATVEPAGGSVWITRPWAMLGE